MGVEADVRGAAVRVAGLGVCCFPRGSQGAGPIQKPTSPEWPMRPRPKRPCGRNLVSGLGLANRRPTRPDVRGVWLYASPPADARCDGGWCQRRKQGAQQHGQATEGRRGTGAGELRPFVGVTRAGSRIPVRHARRPQLPTPTPRAVGRRQVAAPPSPRPGRRACPPAAPASPASAAGHRHRHRSPRSRPTPRLPSRARACAVRGVCAGDGAGGWAGVRGTPRGCASAPARVAGRAGGRVRVRARVWCWARGNAPSEPLDLSPGALRLRAAAPSPRARQAPYNPPHTHLACRSPGGGWPCPRAPALQGRCI